MIGTHIVVCTTCGQLSVRPTVDLRTARWLARQHRANSRHRVVVEPVTKGSGN